MSKRDKRAAVICVAIALVIAAGVIALVVNIFQKDRESPAVAQAFLQALADEREADAWRLMYPGVMAEESFREHFDDLCSFWKEQGGEKTFTIRRTGFSINFSGGMTTYETNYSVKSGKARFHLTVTRVKVDQRSGITGIQLI